MKNFLLLLLVSAIAGGLFAQNKKRSTLIGFQVGTVIPVYTNTTSSTSLNIGLPAFSYAASIEKRFSLHTKLNFSFEYSLHYYKLNQIKAKETTDFLKMNSGNLSSGIKLNSLYQLNKRNSVVLGVGVDKSWTNASLNPKSTETTLGTHKNKMFDISQFKPSLLIGIEKSTKLLNSHLYYTLQYNIGFFPFKTSMSAVSDAAVAPSYLQGIHIGLKYRY